MMIYLHITKKHKNNEVIFSNMPQHCMSQFKDRKNKKLVEPLRSFYQENSKVNIWMISDDEDLYKSSKIFKKTCSFYEEIINQFYDNYSINLLSNIHTITTIQAKMSQKIEGFIDGLEQGKQEQRLEKVKYSLENKNTSETAELICELGKRVSELGTHLDSLKILSDKTITNISKHPLRSVLLNSYAQFKDSFLEKGIKVNLIELQKI